MNPTKVAGSLEITTPSDQEILITRRFDAPRALVWDAFTKPALVTRWMGLMPGWTFPVCEIDLRVGGSYRYVWRGPDGAEMGMGGTYVEVDPPNRLAANEYFDQKWYDGGCLETTTFTESGGVTTVAIRLRYDSREIRDAVLQSPMATGMELGFANLEQLFATLS
jgi:uncharacterized protein YndB with AHSA1/START domain